MPDPLVTRLNLSIPLSVGAMSTGQLAVMLCDWGVKVGMACVWWQVKLCDPLYNTSYVIALEAPYINDKALYLIYNFLFRQS